jgi:hypothetical protein
LETEKELEHFVPLDYFHPAVMAKRTENNKRKAAKTCVINQQRHSPPHFVLRKWGRGNVRANSGSRSPLVAVAGSLSSTVAIASWQRSSRITKRIRNAPEEEEDDEDADDDDSDDEKKDSEPFITRRVGEMGEINENIDDDDDYDDHHDDHDCDDEPITQLLRRRNRRIIRHERALVREEGGREQL